MAKTNSSDEKVYRLVVTALLAAMVYIGTLLRIPLGTSKVHVANAICVFAGFILNPVDAGTAAGLGSAIYDLTLGGYGILDAVITFVSKFLMAALSSVLLRLAKKYIAKGNELEGQHTPVIYIISAISALTYTALYMLKSFMWVTVGLVTVETSSKAAEMLEGKSLLSGASVWMLSKMPASLLNAGVSAFLAPFLYWTVRPALVKAGVIAKLNPTRPN
jgi:uncharacterized membrane protein